MAAASTPLSAGGPQVKFDSLTALEYTTLRVPYEHLNRKFRAGQKSLERGALRVKEAVAAVTPLLSSNQSMPAQQLDAPLRNVIERVEAMEKTFDAVLDEEIRLVELMQQRIEQLMAGEEASKSADPEVSEAAEKQRIIRMAIEQLLRFGYLDTAKMLVESFGLKDMIDVCIYESSEAVMSALREHNMQPALAWCHEHRSKLRRLESRLEVALRLQEAVEFIREGKKMEALFTIRKHIGTAADSQWPEQVEKVMGLLMCGATKVQHADLLEPKQWDGLVTLFRQEHHKVYQLTDHTAFSAALQTGISAYKTPACTPDGNKNCPTCDPTTFELGRNLPFAHASNSRLICAYSGETLNEYNVPLLLPSGFVYGQKALSALREGTMVRCPRSNQLFDPNDVQRIFIL